MDDATHAELAALRRRAYGPDSDISTDPAAIERLSALEALTRRDERVIVDDSGTASSEILNATPPGADPPPPGVDPPPRRTIRVGAAAVIGVGIAARDRHHARTP